MKKDKRRIESNIRKDILNALDDVFPRDVIEMEYGFDDSYFEDIYEKLSRKLSEIETASLDYERDWLGNDPRNSSSEESWEWHYEEDDLDEPIEPPFEDGLASSYHLFF